MSHFFRLYSLNRRLKEARKNARLTQKEIASIIGVNQNTYSYWENGKTKGKGDSPQITIYNKTAVKGDVISIKAFYDTLLHEFIHHYDYEVLKLDRSIHSAGFYKRISDLKNKL